MKTLSYIAIFLIHVTLYSFAVGEEAIGYPPIKEFTQTSSVPEGMKPFSKKQLNDILKNWKHVKKGQFYYESIQVVTFPF